MCSAAALALATASAESSELAAAVAALANASAAAGPAPTGWRRERSQWQPHAEASSRASTREQADVGRQAADAEADSARGPTGWREQDGTSRREQYAGLSGTGGDSDASVRSDAFEWNGGEASHAVRQREAYQRETQPATHRRDPVRRFAYVFDRQRVLQRPPPGLDMEEDIALA